MIVVDTMQADLTVTSDVAPTALRTWTAREGLEAVCSREGERLVATSSGCAACFGGWDIVFEGIEGGEHYSVGLDWEAAEMAGILDGMPLLVFWTNDEDERVDFDYLIIHEPDATSGRAERVLQAHPNATRVVLRVGVRWTATGKASFANPSVNRAEAPEKVVARIAVASGQPQGSETIAENVAFFSALVREAAECKPDLVLMPEVINVWTLPDRSTVKVDPIPGPTTEAFAALARECNTMIAFSMKETEGDLYYNTEVIIDRDGAILGTYRKVHLAITEGWDGTSPGDELPVIDTPIGKVAPTICKDSSLLDSSRVPALKGAEIILLSIMGDHRAVGWRRTPSAWDPDRWKVIMRARAIENHMWMVVARNNSEGSCIVAPSGEILAWNSGGQSVIWADCEISEKLRTYRGASFHDATWAERRPHLY